MCGARTPRAAHRFGLQPWTVSAEAVPCLFPSRCVFFNSRDKSTVQRSIEAESVEQQDAAIIQHAECESLKELVSFDDKYLRNEPKNGARDGR